MNVRAAILVICLVLGFAAAPPPARAEKDTDKPEPQALVTAADESLKRFVADPEMTWFRDHAPQARALLIVPKMVRGGFIFGGSGGRGVLLARDPKTGDWSQPAFYAIGSMTFGLQIGAELSEVILVVMTDAGVDSLLSTSFKLGGDVSVAAGPVGAGAKAATADVLAFSRSKGLFGGLNVEGAIVNAKPDWNQAYYGRPTSATDILIRRQVSNPGSATLRGTVAAATHK
ncbi:MAG: lipid-binding SYLF domain-containing protein [Hyphomicrobiales bacterium]|nr:lipid-binding SYLF domain-containing protein [Hyphomicrobiales bacterium]